MRYLVTARVKPGREQALLDAIESKILGRGSVAGGEYLRNMFDARLRDDGTIRWVEVCFCDVPLDEERPYWEGYLELVRVQDCGGTATAMRRAPVRERAGRGAEMLVRRAFWHVAA